MKKTTLFFCMVLSAAWLGAGANAADINEEQTTEKYLGTTETKTYKKVEEIKQGKRYKTKLLVSVAQGYDNNVYLDPERKEDTFTEAILDAGVSYPLSGRWDFKGEVSAHDITYWEATHASLIDTDLKLGFEGRLFWGITLTAMNDIEMLEYQSNDNGEYVGDKVDLGLRQKLPDNFFHAFGYQYFYKNYSDRKARNGWGGLSDKDRIDHRNTIYYEYGKYLKKAMVKVFGEYYLNKSNDQYLDYYDYDSIRLGSSVIYLLTSKMSAYASFYEQFKHYSDRTIPGDVTTREHDRTWVTTASVFYDIRKNTTLGLSYSYRQNHSNYPAQKYSGSITSLGLYCRF